MINTLLSFIAPHLCSGCAKTGTLLCENCKYNIVDETETRCCNCGLPASASGVCKGCTVSYQRAWCVGERSGVLQRLVDDYKFHYVYDAHKPLADLLLHKLGDLPKNVIIVPVPTVSGHVRERGYDHIMLLAKRVANHHHLPLQSLVSRLTRTKQRGASRRQREAQAKVAFSIEGAIDPTVIYLVIDDVTTTGATLRHVAQALRRAGASTIWVAVIARQPLD